MAGREVQCWARRLFHQLTQRELTAAVASRLIEGIEQPIDRGHGEVARGSVAAALAARDLEDLAYAHAPDVACRQQLVIIRNDEESGALEGRCHLRNCNARESELLGQPVHAPAPAAAEVGAADEVHELECKLLELLG